MNIRCYLLAAMIFSVLTLVLYKNVPSADAHLEIDSNGYDRIARHFAATSELHDPADPLHHPVQTLAYPLFLGLIYKVFGVSYGAVVAMQWFLALMSGLFLYIIAALLFNPTVACITAGLWSINLGFLVYVQFLLTELLFITFLLAFLASFSFFLVRKKELFLGLAGFLLGCSVIIKPASLFFIVPLALFILIFTKETWRKTMQLSLLLLATFYVPVLSYMTLNKIRFGYFKIAPMMDEILYRYLTARVKGKLYNVSHEKVLVDEQWFEGTHIDDTQGWLSAKQFLKSTLIEHPLLIPTIWLQNVMKTFLGLFTTQLKVLVEPAVQGGDCSFFKVEGTISQRIIGYITYGTNSVALHTIGFVEAGWQIIRYVLILLALCMLLMQKRYELLSFFVIYLGYFSFITGHDGCCRYRMMIEPMLIILSAVGIWIIWWYAASGRRKDLNIF